VSFIAFVAANCITDVESIYNVLNGNFPVHRFLHTFLGAAVVTGLTIALFLSARRLAVPLRLPDLFQWQHLSLMAVAVGAIVGAYSHILLDGIMHADMRPFAPWSDANPLFQVISLSTLHWACVMTGVVGLGILLRSEASSKSEP
jgi:membrane-bound metal-dependent hydrolase YbcI (DUF457 family)